MKRSLEMPLADRRTDGTEFIGDPVGSARGPTTYKVLRNNVQKTPKFSAI